MNYFYQLAITLSPAEVKFTQDTVGQCFQNDNELNKTCEDIVKNIVSVRNIKKIRVVLMDDKYYRYNLAITYNVFYMMQRVMML